METLFEALLLQINGAGLTARKGQVVDAALVPAPKQRNSREINADIKEGKVPEEWSDSQRSQKDVQARWTKKHGKSHDGYNNHVWADSAYRSTEMEKRLRDRGYRSHVHRKGSRKRALNSREQEANRKRSKVRARMEHVFDQQQDRLIRTIGKERAEVKIGFMSLVYNMRRWAWLAG
jgi:IS5 family transposase